MKRVVQVILVVAMVVLCFSGAYAGTTERVSVDSLGNQADGGSFTLTNYIRSITPDGRYVLFTSSTTNLVTGDTNGYADVFVHDRATGNTERVSVDSNGNEANGANTTPSISADGRYVAFASYANNLVTGDTNGYADVFVHDRATGTTELVSVAYDGSPADEQSNSYTSISSDGRYVAFKSYATNIVAGDMNGAGDVFVRDRLTGTTALASVSSGGVQGDDLSNKPSISADGRYVEFESRATNLVAGDTNGKQDIFVHDTLTGATVRVSVASDGREATGGTNSWTAEISAGGRYVVFTSDHMDLVPGDANGVHDIFLHDRDADGNGIYDEPGGISTELVSIDSSGNQANGHSYYPFISADGRYVVFLSYATNLVPGDTNGVRDDFVRDRATGITERVSVDSNGNEADGMSYYPTITDDGRYAAFASAAANLVPGDTNGVYDIFVRTRDIDFDADGYNELEDCNDNDATVYPGAPEVKHDGIDQDCNGYDLTIDITMAAYDIKKDSLRVEATSSLGAGAGLELTGYGPMEWKVNQLTWVITVEPAGGDPVTVEVCGVEGCESAPTTAE